MNSKAVHVRIRSPLSCFYCWRHIPPQKLKWIAESRDLDSDERLGEAQQRFVPTRFTPDGFAIDSNGGKCDKIACPNCHLPVPRQSLRTRPFFISVAGTPSSGKTFFLTAMVNTLRKVLVEKACFSFDSLESGGSKLLFENESRLFGHPDSDQLVSLEKTQEFGELYRLVQFNQELVSYPQPFLFDLHPTLSHPNRRAKQKISRLFALYDNAGESFDKGRDSLVNPVTRHLGLANVLMYCLDLNQEQSFQSQIRKPVNRNLRPGHQLESFREMCQRAIQYAPSKSTKRNLIVVITKFDEWSSKLGIPLTHKLWSKRDQYSISAFDTEFVNQTSQKLRDVLQKRVPEFVEAAESFSDRVRFIPVSAIGSAPESLEDGSNAVRPNKIKPIWTEVPLVYSMAKWCGGQIPYSKAKTTTNEKR